MELWKTIKDTKVYKFICKLLDEIEKNHIFLIASGISFNVILYILPLLLMSVYVITLFFDPTFSINLIDKLLVEVLPQKLYDKSYFEAIKTEINFLFEYRSYFGLFGVLTILWLSSALVSSIRYGLNLIFQINEGKLSFLYRFKDMFVILVFTTLLLLYAFVLPILKITLNTINLIGVDLFHFQSSNFLIAIVTFATSTLLYLLIYLLVPSSNIGFKLITFSTLFTVLSQELFSYLFSFYITMFDSYGKVYGSLGVLIAIAMWLYYSSLILLFSSVLSKVIFGLKPTQNTQTI